MTLLVGLIVSLAFIIISSNRFRLHPFLSLFFGALIYGFISGMSPDLIIKSINEGFGGLMGNIGLIILFGVMIGTFLEKSGGAMAVANAVLSFIGEKFITFAMMITGYIVSIPVFADSGFIILSPLNKALSHKAAVPIAGTTAALAIGLLASHVMVPPTPGPIAATGIIGAPLGQVMLWGLIVSLIACVITYFFIIKVVSKVQVEKTAEIPALNKTSEISAFKSFLPILLPIVLILLASIAKMPGSIFGESTLSNWIQFLGQPIIALVIGLLLAFTLPQKWDKQLLSTSGWIGESLKEAAPILLITGAGGIFGKILQFSGIGDMISSQLNIASLGLLLPFLLAAALKSSQGSSTVALVTSASIMVPLLNTMGLDNAWMMTLTVLSIAAGSAVVSHVNDSLFWVVTQMSGFNLNEGYRIHTLTTGVFGVTAMLIVLALSVLV